jgi:hypothetical protein
MGNKGNLGLSQFLFHRYTKQQQKKLELFYTLSRKLKHRRNIQANEDSSCFRIPEKKIVHKTSMHGTAVLKFESGAH